MSVSNLSALVGVMTKAADRASKSLFAILVKSSICRFHAKARLIL